MNIDWGQNYNQLYWKWAGGVSKYNEEMKDSQIIFLHNKNQYLHKLQISKIELAIEINTIIVISLNVYIYVYYILIYKSYSIKILQPENTKYALGTLIQN